MRYDTDSFSKPPISFSKRFTLILSASASSEFQASSATAFMAESWTFSPSSRSELTLRLASFCCPRVFFNHASSWVDFQKPSILSRARHTPSSRSTAPQCIRRFGRIEFMKKLRILLADDHIVTRTGLRALLERQPNLEVVGESENGLEKRTDRGLRPSGTFG